MIVCEITKQNRQQDIHKNFPTIYDALIYISQNTVENDGYRIIEHYEVASDIADVVDKVILVTTKKNKVDDIKREFPNITEANKIINTLDTSDGYELLYQDKVIQTKPSLWKARFNKDNKRERIEWPRVLASKPNKWNRKDEDRN